MPGIGKILSYGALLPPYQIMHTPYGAHLS